jgi:Tfp pilus assembly protein PilP
LKQRLKKEKKFNNIGLITPLMLMIIAAVMTGCSDSGKAPGPSAPIAPKQAQQVVTQPTVTVIEEKPQVAYTYNPVGRREPFAPLIVKQETTSKLGDRPPLERYNLYEFKMMGVIWGGFGYNAMLEGPDGKGYFVRVGTVIGPNKGVVKKITQTTIVVEEKFKSFSGTPERKETVIQLRKKQEGIQ